MRQADLLGADKARAGADPMLMGVEDGLLAWGTDEGRSSVRGERDRDKLVGRKWTSNGLPCGASGAEVSWLETDKFFFSFFSFLCGVGGALGVRTRSWRWTSGR